MAKWEDRPNCPSCAELHTVDGTLANGHCNKCGWAAGPMKVIRDNAAKTEAPRGCPGCGGHVEGLDKDALAATGKLALCEDCHREPIEYLRLAAGTQLRDQLAAAALTGLLAHARFNSMEGTFTSVKETEAVALEMLSKGAYSLAAAMMAEREKVKPVVKLCVVDCKHIDPPEGKRHDSKAPGRHACTVFGKPLQHGAHHPRLIAADECDIAEPVKGAKE